MEKIYSLTQALAANGSRIMKENMLRQFEDQETLKTVLRLAYDPFTMFGVTDFMDSVGYSGDDVVRVLERCASRELTGGAARSALGSALKNSSTELKQLVRNILNKDLRCGVSEKTVAKLYPGLIRQFDVMRAEKYNPQSKHGPVYVEPKFDGLRSIGVVEGGKVTLLSRNGKEFTAADHLKPLLLTQGAELGDRVFDGELVAAGGFNSSVSSVKRKVANDNPATFHCFEMIPMNEWGDGKGLPYELRRQRLQEYTRPGGHFQVAESWLLRSDEVWPKYLDLLRRGLEGAIVKNPEGLYRFKRHTDWLKLKETCDVDAKVIRLIEGEGRLRGMLGAAVILYNGKEVNVGTGWSDKERKHYWMYPSQLVNHMIEVQYHQETPDGSLRHPRFSRMRPDLDSK